jgi:hypothetical protein
MSKQLTRYVQDELYRADERIAQLQRDLDAAYVALRDAETAMLYATEGAYICKPVDDWEERYTDIRKKAKGAKDAKD